MSKSLQTALKQLRQASTNLSIEAADGAQPEAHRDAMRSARFLVDQIANAIEFGDTYVTTGRAEEFDHQNKIRKS